MNDWCVMVKRENEKVKEEWKAMNGHGIKGVKVFVKRNGMGW